MIQGLLLSFVQSKFLPIRFYSGREATTVVAVKQYSFISIWAYTSVLQYIYHQVYNALVTIHGKFLFQKVF